MKKLLIIFIFLFNLTTSCESNEDDNPEIGVETRTEWECGTHNGNTLYTGPQGGCYYYNSNGNKTYVDRLECNC